MGKRTDTEPQKSTDHIDQIRDIIFGAQNREYERRFEKLESTLSATQKEVTKQIEDIRNSLSKEIDVAAQALEKKIKLLTTATQEEGSAVRKQIEQTDAKFSNSLHAFTEQTTDGMTSLHKEIAEAKNKLQLDIRALQEQLCRDLEAQLGVLQQDKISKESLAELLLELGMRVKEVELVSTLEKAAKITSKSGG